MEMDPNAETVLLEVSKEEINESSGMKEYSTPDGDILLVEQAGNYFAIGAKCSHYGAPLYKGALGNGKVRCPWHGACFNIRTGDIEDYPGLDSLPKFNVTLTDDKIMVWGTKDLVKRRKRVRSIVMPIISLDKTVIIVGGGPAAETCLETLRFNGYQGRILLLTKEKHIPYDRPKLSKNMELPVCSLYLRNYQYYEDGQIELLLNREVKAINFSEKLVYLGIGSTLSYTEIVLCTGSEPRKLSLPGDDYENIFYLRTPEDANKISSNASGKKVVIIGSSFIGMETASYLVNKASEVTVLCRADVPFAKTLGNVIGGRLMRLFEENGVKFKVGCKPVKFIGEDGRLTGIEIENEVLNCDMCVVGVGATPATAFLEGSGIQMNENGFLEVDEYLSSNMENVYACGDIASFPLFFKENEKVSIGHFQMAQAHGRTAALSILGKPQAIVSVPFFWTAFFGKSLRHAGYNVGHDSTIVHGSLEDLMFAVFYCIGESVVAISTMNMDPLASQFSELLLNRVIIKSSLVRDSLDHLKELYAQHVC